ncbi:MAG: ribulose-phosphate 3-epimerase [Clostridia bacterium]|nr:ribulose-phosphate 3-epimerase [Clostridia bacterium]
MRKGFISPSMMCVDLMNAQRDTEALEKVNVDYLHVDVMDNHFVPNITLSTDFVKALKGITKLPLDVHLMVEDPMRVTIPQLSCCGEGDIISIHYEATVHPLRALTAIRQLGCKAGIAINPATPICVLEDLLDDVDMVLIMTVNPGFAGQKLVASTLKKITRLRAMLEDSGHGDMLIEVDGNVSFENAVKMRDAGADIYVAGSSSVFSRGASLAENVKRFREIIG